MTRDEVLKWRWCDGDLTPQEIIDTYESLLDRCRPWLEEAKHEGCHLRTCGTNEGHASCSCCRDVLLDEIAEVK